MRGWARHCRDVHSCVQRLRRPRGQGIRHVPQHIPEGSTLVAFCSLSPDSPTQQLRINFCTRISRMGLASFLSDCAKDETCVSVPGARRPCRSAANRLQHHAAMHPQRYRIALAICPAFAGEHGAQGWRPAMRTTMMPRVSFAPRPAVKEAFTWQGRRIRQGRRAQALKA